MSVDKKGKQLPKGIRLRKDGRYEGRFRYKGEDYNVIDKELKSCIKRITDLRYEVEHGIFVKEENISVDSWFNVWIKEYKELSVKIGTLNVYKTTYNTYIKDVIGDKRLKDIRPEHIQRIYNDLSRNKYN